MDAKKIAIVFDTFLENDAINRMPDCLAKDYDLKVYTRKGTIVKSIVDNDKRYAVHEINAEGIHKIEITINSSWGNNAGIYGVKLL